MISKVNSFFKAVTGGTSTEREAARRLRICETCPKMKVIGTRKYCDSCGCPQSRLWPMAELHNKVKMKQATCPLGKWGPPVNKKRKRRKPIPTLELPPGMLETHFRPLEREHNG